MTAIGVKTGKGFPGQLSKTSSKKIFDGKDNINFLHKQLKPERRCRQERKSKNHKVAPTTKKNANLGNKKNDKYHILMTESWEREPKKHGSGYNDQKNLIPFEDSKIVRKNIYLLEPYNIDDSEVDENKGLINLKARKANQTYKNFRL